MFEHSATPTIFYKSTIAWNGVGWDLRLKNGTVLVFGDLTPLMAIRDRNGNVLSIQRDEFENITRVTSPNGRWIEFTHDGLDRITQAKDNIGRVVTYGYDAAGRLSTVTDPMGGLTKYTYDSQHRMKTLKDARGIVFLTNQYNGADRVTTQTQADSTTFQFAYTLDAGGKVLQADVTDPRGNVERLAFNGAGFLMSDTRAVGKPVAQTMAYDRLAGTNQVLSVTDALGRKTAFQYDGLGNVTGITRLAGTPQAVTTTLSYESTFSQVKSLSDPLGHATTLKYDANGNPTSVTNPLGKKTILTSNAAGQPVTITDPLGNMREFGYDRGDPASVTDALGNRASWFLDAAGRLVSFTDPLGNSTLYDYDAHNRLVKVTDPFGGITTFGYDPNGNLLSVTDAHGKATTYTYDPMDRLATRKDPLLRLETFEYNASGALRKFTDRKGQLTSYSYDALERRTTATYADASSVSYGYDAGNRLTGVTDTQSGTIGFVYDDLDRLLSESNPRGMVTYSHDAADRRTGMTVQGQTGVAYGYDDADRLTQVVQGASTVSLVYDAAGRRTKLTLPNGVVVNYGYDATNRLTGLTYKKSGTTIADLSYAYDAAGNRKMVGGSWARTNLPAAVSASYDAANEQVAFGGQSLSYDANGSLINDGAVSYVWDARGQLASMTAPTFTAAFQYDGLGRRIQRAVGSDVRDYLYDGLTTVQELSGATPSANMLTGLAIDEVFARTDAGGTRSLVRDALGSTVALTNNAGVVQTEYIYEPFGRTVAVGIASSNSIQFTGRDNDDTSLFYYRTRYYSSFFARFISEDWLHFASPTIRLNGRFMDGNAFCHLLGTLLANQHLYAYAGNAPTLWTDPLGLQYIDVGCSGTGFGIGAVKGGQTEDGRHCTYSGIAFGMSGCQIFVAPTSQITEGYGWGVQGILPTPVGGVLLPIGFGGGLGQGGDGSWYWEIGGGTSGLTGVFYNVDCKPTSGRY